VEHDTGRQPASGAAVSGILRVPRSGALAAIAVLVAGALLVSFAESYRGLYLWAHGLGGLWAVAWPLQVDTFIAVGELALFAIDRVSSAATPGHVRGVGMVTAREAATFPARSCMTPSEPLTP
jgi:hypothetical protein